MRERDLFDHAHEERLAREAPLAARMRPRVLDEFVGQQHVVGPGRLLRRAIQADQISSLIFYGPPGTGKTTLAMVIANTTHSRFVTLNAVLAGVKDIRQVTAAAQDQAKLYGQRTILFVDEVHRWNKAQQDALLPWVENGTIVMIGATTENPWFSVNRALLSRSRVFQLVPLTEDDLRLIAQYALDDPDRGYGELDVEIEPDALDHLVNVANGDARSLLNALELGIETTSPNERGVTLIDITVAEESIQRRAVLYDREGDYHFDTISAFIKSVRGSDPDAALYWLAKMVYAGEDPRFIFRRMLISASEDIGLADPAALGVVESAAAAFERVGLPEGRFHLAQATLYLATASKSNSIMAFFEALARVENERDGEVPTHLKDASRDKEGFGHGEGYLYPHAYRDHWIAQQYLPQSLQGAMFYDPSDQGYERSIRERVRRRREEQLAAVVEEDASTDALTFSPENRQRERWLMRAISNAGANLGQMRDRILSAVVLRRHDLVLDIHAATGLLTWEALRRVPEGGVWALAREATSARALQEQAERLDEIERPVILAGALDDLADLVAAADPDGGEIRFDLVVGRNGLIQCSDKVVAARVLVDLVQHGGTISLADTMPRYTQRLCDLVDTTLLGSDLTARLREAEEAIYGDMDDPMTNWDAPDLRAAFESVGASAVSVEVQRVNSERPITSNYIARWFDDSPRERLTYAGHLAKALSPQEIARVRALFEQQLVGQICTWGSQVAYAVVTV